MGTFRTHTATAGWMRLRAGSLRAAADAMASDLPSTTGTSGSGALLALDETAHYLMEAERQRLDELLKRDHILRQCANDLAGPSDAGRVSAESSVLLSLADRMEVLEARASGRGWLRFLHGGAAPLAAIGIAGGALAVVATVVNQPGWVLPGLLLSSAGFGPLLLLMFTGWALRRSAISEQRRVGARALDALARCRVVLTDEAVPDPDALRAHAASVGRRDLLASLRTRLRSLALDDDDGARLRLRRQELEVGVDDQRALALITGRPDDPVLAVAALSQAMHDAFGRARAQAHSAGRTEGAALGGAHALRAEASRLDALASGPAAAPRGRGLRAVRDVPSPADSPPRRLRRGGRARAAATLGRPWSSARRLGGPIDGPVDSVGTSRPASDGVWPRADVLREAARRAEERHASVLRACASVQTA